MSPAGFALDQSPAKETSCASSTLEKVRELTQTLKQRHFVINDLFSMMVPETRQAVRAYYKLGQLCQERAVVERISEDLLEFGYPIQYLPDLFGRSLKELNLRMYQIGDAWDRVKVDKAALTPVQQKLFSATAVGGLIREEGGGEKPKLILYSVGTGFFVRTRLKSVVIATALHVFGDNAKNYSAERACQEMVWHFPSGKKVYYRGKNLLYKNEALDFALCELEIPAADLDLFKDRALELNDQPLKADQPLNTIGFGVYQNDHPGIALLEAGQDCRSFLPGEEASVRARTWSLPTGCDASPADSGSAVMNAHSGKVEGILWGTSTVKRNLSSQDLRSLAKDPSKREILWSELSLMVPAQKIAAALKQTGLL